MIMQEAAENKFHPEHKNSLNPLLIEGHISFNIWLQCSSKETHVYLIIYFWAPWMTRVNVGSVWLLMVLYSTAINFYCLKNTGRCSTWPLPQGPNKDLWLKCYHWSGGWRKDLKLIFFFALVSPKNFFREASEIFSHILMNSAIWRIPFKNYFFSWEGSSILFSFFSHCILWI